MHKIELKIPAAPADSWPGTLLSTNNISHHHFGQMTSMDIGRPNCRHSHPQKYSTKTIQQNLLQNYLPQSALQETNMNPWSIVRTRV